MDLKEFIHRWLTRHTTGPNRILHTIGIPATIVAVVLLFFHLWLLAAVCFVGGYVLQTIGHYLEGSRVGEVLLLKKIVFPSGGFAKRFSIICLVLAVLVVGGLLIQSLVSRCVYFNFYQSVGAGMYRSGQMPPERLGTIIDKLGIKTVVNLRGEEDKPWYVAERETVEQNEARLINLGFSASRYPDPARLRELLDVVERIEPPFLVHCKGGADRTGLFFVLLALREGQSWSEAMRQLSLLRFNYYDRMKSATITYPLYDFADYADEHHWPRDLKHFRQWLKSEHARQTHQNWLQQQNR